MDCSDRTDWVEEYAPVTPLLSPADASTSWTSVESASDRTMSPWVLSKPATGASNCRLESCRVVTAT